jgi:hypothetical protein
MMMNTDTSEQNEPIELWDWEYDDDTDDPPNHNYWEDYTPGEDL